MPTPAVMTIDQATLTAGVAGRSRRDGVPAQLVTVTADATGSTYALEILSIAPTTDTAPTLTQTSTRTWTFTPPAGAYGRTYRLRLTVDAGTTDEQTTTRIFAIPSLVHGFVPPSPGERGDPEAALSNQGADVIAASEDNTGGNPWGYGPRLDALYRAADSMLGCLVVSGETASGSGTTPVLVGAAYLAPGAYAAPRAYLGCQDPGDAATLEVRLESDGTTLATIGGAAGILTDRAAASGFTLTGSADTLVGFYLYADDAAATAQVRAVRIRRA